MAETKIVVDCTKGTTAYLPLSAAEIAQRDQIAAATAEEQAEREAQQAAQTAAKAAALAKLQELGLTVEEATAVL
jgi:uncharacterized protein YqfA (UPF0365 family)